MRVSDVKGKKRMSPGALRGIGPLSAVSTLLAMWRYSAFILLSSISFSFFFDFVLFVVDGFWSTRRLIIIRPESIVTIYTYPERKQKFPFCLMFVLYKNYWSHRINKTMGFDDFWHSGTMRCARFRASRRLPSRTKRKKKTKQNKKWSSFC